MSDWYRHSFGSDYLIVYKHRDMQGAYEEVKKMIAWLELPEGSEVLDLCCGMGRHSMALNEFGYEVTGVDLSEVLLNEARKLDTDDRVRWIQGDMREVPVSRTFDGIVNLFTSFGYFEQDSENAKVLQEMDRLLKPGGKFLIDFLNADVVEARLVPRSERSEDGMHIEEIRQIQDGFVRKTILISEQGQETRKYLEQVKLYGVEEFKSLLAPTGLIIDKIYGDYEANSFDPSNSPRLIIVGHKRGE